MKNKILLPIAAAVLMMTSCGEEWLDVASKGSILETDYYNSQDRLFSGVTAAYDPLQWFDYFSGYTPLNLLSDIMADDIYCGGSNEGDQPVLVKTHYYTCSSTDVPSGVWTVCYSGINRANIVLAKAPEVEMDESLKNRYVAECLVLKAFYWDQLWKFWGNIPYYDENLTAEQQYSAEQLTADEVYEKVIALIEEALAMNVLPMKAVSGEEGRVTKAMAYMLFTEMVMYQNDSSRYSTALNYMKEIIGSGSYSLNPDFASIWEESGEWCSESIWEINYEPKGGNRSWGWANGSGGSVYPVFIGIPGASDGVYHDGWGFSPVAESAYAMYEDGDQRRDGGIIDYRDKSYNPRWQNTGFFLLKYIAREGGNEGFVGDADLNYNNNVRVYRYSEALLNAAELSLATGADGSSYLNEVRARAGLDAVACTLDNIIEERHLEFVGEGKRYWDLVRTGKAASVLTADKHQYRTTDWTASKKYWPIPQSELDRSVTELTQNPY